MDNKGQELSKDIYIKAITCGAITGIVIALHNLIINTYLILHSL